MQVVRNRNVLILKGVFIRCVIYLWRVVLLCNKFFDKKCRVLPSMFKLIFQSAPIGVTFGQIGYWNDTRQYFFYFFDFTTITVITILHKKGQNTENTTFFHVKMTAFPAFPPGKSYQNRVLRTKWS